MNVLYYVAGAFALLAVAGWWKVFDLAGRLTRVAADHARGNKERSELTAALIDAGKVELHQANLLQQTKNQIAELTPKLEPLASGLEAMRARAHEEHARAERYFVAIDSACKQRDEWCEKYHTAVLGFMRTQEALLNELERLSRAAKVAVRPLFRQLVDGYREEHRAALATTEEKPATPETPNPT